MRVPGNERAFTVSPTRGIPFPQLVCIEETDGQSQAFPVSAWARPAAALLELARAPPRATVRAVLHSPWVGLPGAAAPLVASVLETPKQESRDRSGLGTEGCVRRSPGPGDQREGDALCSLDTKLPPRGFRDLGWHPGMVPRQPCTAVHEPRLGVLGGQGGIRPQEGWRADGRVGEALSASLGQTSS